MKTMKIFILILWLIIAFAFGYVARMSSEDTRYICPPPDKGLHQK